MKKDKELSPRDLRRPIKVLQVVYSMNRGGVESWLMQVLRKIDRKLYSIDFLVHISSPGDYDEDIRSLGCSIYRSENMSKPWVYFGELRRFLSEHGPYDVIHSHSEIFSGIAMYLGRRAGVLVRIAHIHNDVQLSKPESFPKKIFYYWSIRASKKFSSHILICSASAADSYGGKCWSQDARYELLFCGQDFEPFTRTKIRPELARREFSIPKDSFVVGHVGSFRNDHKNHFFIIDIAAEMVRINPVVVFLLVGAGERKEVVENRVQELGLQRNIIFAGVRSDIPHLMLSVMDVFLFPSKHEGLGIVMIEAQAAGLRCICSDRVPSEADVVPGLVSRMPLEIGPKEWALALSRLSSERSPFDRKEALRVLENSRFNISSSIERLESIYSGDIA